MQWYGSILIWISEYKDCYIMLCTEHGLHNSVHSACVVSFTVCSN